MHRLTTPSVTPVEYPPDTQPPPAQCCEAHPQSLYQSFGHQYPLSPSPSPINFCTPVVHSSHNTYRVVYGRPAHPTFILMMYLLTTPSVTPVEYPPATQPPLTQCCEAHPQCLY
ncbi:hypothetical protein T01_11115 [Trichinella spiralis]|uniref:Uncharacterized protein n=1 Tax=Trichinella spiralis TaxID=6334 RepID=A0A0V1AL25_TRISP|nr:hypothetical protein T01_11115 [Trichinella spiralis]